LNKIQDWKEMDEEIEREGTARKIKKYLLWGKCK
jgi:hypothetical protein